MAIGFGGLLRLAPILGIFLWLPVACGSSPMEKEGKEIRTELEALATTGEELVRNESELLTAVSNLEQRRAELAEVLKVAKQRVGTLEADLRWLEARRTSLQTARRVAANDLRKANIDIAVFESGSFPR